MKKGADEIIFVKCCGMEVGDFNLRRHDAIHHVIFRELYIRQKPAFESRMLYVAMSFEKATGTHQ